MKGGAARFKNSRVLAKGIFRPGTLGPLLDRVRAHGGRSAPTATSRARSGGAAAIQQARVSVNIAIFIWKPGDPSERMLKALEERVQAGVKCRAIVDPVGSTPAFQLKVRPRLRSLGCDVQGFRPMRAGGTSGFWIARNHRKLVIVDGKVAFTGGFGFSQEWLGDGLHEGQWRNTAVRVEGPPVELMQVAFAVNWQEAGGALLTEEDFPEPGRAGTVSAAFIASSAGVGPSNADRLTELAFASARNRLWIASAYFVPPDNVLRLLQAKARQGVDVRALVPGVADDEPDVREAQRAVYEQLLRAGVRIWEYQPTMMHAKTLLIDDRLMVVGSINMDSLSLKLLKEGALVTTSASLNAELAGRFLGDLQHAKQMTL